MKVKFVNYIFVTLALLICYLPVLSQNKCNLQIGIYEFKEDGSSEQFPIRDAKILLVSTKTKKSLKINKNTDTPTFADVVDGEYQITVSKEDFKRTSSIFLTDCSLADAQNIISKIIFLWKGSSKETAKFGSLGSKGGYYNTGSDQSVNNGAVLLAKPEYPRAARAVRAAGAVNVQVTINELGYIISAQAISGHPLLRAAAVKAAKTSKFRMTMLEGIPVKVTGVIVYNFVP